MLIERAAQYLDRAFPFEVYKEQLRRCDNDTTYYGLFRTDNNEQVSDRSVSESYVAHTTEDIKNIVIECINIFSPTDGYLDHMRTWFNKGHYVCIAPSTDYRKRMHRYDSVYPRIHVYAGLGGISSIHIRVGWWREKCGNLAMPKLVDGMSINIRHSKSMTDKLNDIRNGGLLNAWTESKYHMEKMQDKRINMHDAMHSIYGEPTPQRQTSYEARTHAILSRIMRERRESVDYGEVGGLAVISGWELYNGVQGYYQHTAPMRGRIGELIDIGRDELDSDVKWHRMVATAKNKYVLEAEQLAVSA